MTENKHTPGPWLITDNCCELRPEAIYAYPNGAGCIVATTWSIVPEEQRKSNAKLIAMAPTLLKQRDELVKASTALLKQWDEFDETGPCPSDELMEKLRASLKSVEEK
jgi:hypothetical protein